MLIKLFPVLGDHSSLWKRFPDCPKFIDLSIIAPHEAQAIKNHSQTLSELSRRGGLSPDELCAVINDRAWYAMPEE